MPAPKPKKKITLRRRGYSLKWTFRVRVNGKDKWQTTDEEDWDIAQGKARILIRKLKDGKIEELRKIGAIRAPKIPKVGEVIALYTAEGGHELAGIKLLTLKRNAEALRRFVAIAEGIVPLDNEEFKKRKFKNRREGWAEKRRLNAAHMKKVDSQPLSVLTEQSVYAFQRNGLAHGYSPVGLNSTLNQARSVFSTPARFFSSITLPDLKGFQGGSPIPQSHGESAYQEIPKATLEALEKDANRERAKGNLDLWRTYLLFRRLGLRNIEIKSAKGDWIAEHKGKMKLCVINRPGVFTPKAKIERRISLSKELLAEFANIQPHQHLIAPNGTVAARVAIVDKECNVLVRRHLGDTRQKASYELRKQAGAEIASHPEGGIYMAHKFLGHSNISTTEKHYSAYIGELKALEH